MAYVGRFAPSPTGPLHLVHSLPQLPVTAMPKPHQGTWLVRIEDTDIPAFIPAAKSISCVPWMPFGFEPDAEIIFQKDRLDIYEDVIQQLRQQGLVYACQCTRKMLGSNHIYQDTCRDLSSGF